MSRLRSRLAFLCVLALSLVLQSILSTPALAYQSGEVIVICGEFGAAEIRIDADGNEISSDEPPCTSCGDCPLCVVGSEIDLTGEFFLPGRMSASLIQGVFARDSHTPNPAQFWADNRGPPARLEKALYLAMTLFMGPTCTEGRAPWI